MKRQESADCRKREERKPSFPFLTVWKEVQKAVDKTGMKMESGSKKAVESHVVKRRIRKCSLKKGFVLAGILVVSLGLCACHGKGSTGEFQVPESFDTSRNYEITFWAKNDTNKTQTEIYKKAITDFEKCYPNITVNLKLYTDYGKIYNDVITNIATDTPPNVCITYPDHVATYNSGQNTVVPLDVLMEDPAYGLGGEMVAFDAPKKDQLTEKFLEECMLNGQTMALPFMRSTEVCYINQDLVEALGYEVPDVLTWDYIWEVSEAATKKNEDGTYALNGQEVMIPFIDKSTDNMMIEMLKQKKAGYSDENGDILLFNDTTTALLMEIAGHVKTGAFSTFKISSYPANFLNAGQCVFAIDSTAGATWMGSEAPLLDISEENIVPFHTQVRMIPQFDQEHPQMISQGPSICIFNKKDSQEVLASWLFAQFLLTDKVQTAYAKTEGYIPVTSKARESAEYQGYLSRAGEDNEEHYEVKIEAAKILLEHTEDSFVTPAFNGSTALRNAAGDLIEETAKGVRRKKEVNEDFISQLYEDMTSLYHLDEKAGALSGKQDLGPLPHTAVALLAGLGAVWAGILLYVLYEFVRRKKGSGFKHYYTHQNLTRNNGNFQ